MALKSERQGQVFKSLKKKKTHTHNTLDKKNIEAVYFPQHASYSGAP